MKPTQLTNQAKLFLTLEKTTPYPNGTKESTYTFTIHLEEVIKKYIKRSSQEDFPIRYTAMKFNKIDEGKEYFLSKNHLSKKRNSWLKSHVIYNTEDEINSWKVYLKNYLGNIVIGSDDIYGLEFLAKVRSLTSHYGEPSRSSLQPFSLDEGYEFLFDSDKAPLENEFRIEYWSVDKKDDSNFKMIAYCSINFLDKNYNPILFSILIMSYEKLINISGTLKTLERPLCLIISNHTNKDELEMYMKDTFKNIKGSSVEEIELKLATFTQDIDVIPLLKKAFHKGEPYSLEIVEQI